MPYHWSLNEETWRGRSYHGCLRVCLNLLMKEKPSLESKILDAGCGDGFLLSKLKKRGLINLYGVDYSERAIAFARLLVPGVEFCVDRLEVASYPDNFFDAVFLVDVLEHILPEEAGAVLKNIYRVLAKDGFLIISVPSIIEPINRKHFQHFSEGSMKLLVDDFFVAKKIIGQDKKSFAALFYKFLDNRFWKIKKLSHWYNMNIWPKFFNECHPSVAKKLIFLYRKKPT